MRRQMTSAYAAADTCGITTPSAGSCSAAAPARASRQQQTAAQSAAQLDAVPEPSALAPGPSATSHSQDTRRDQSYRWLLLLLPPGAPPQASNVAEAALPAAAAASPGTGARAGIVAAAPCSPSCLHQARNAVNNYSSAPKRARVMNWKARRVLRSKAHRVCVRSIR